MADVQFIQFLSPDGGTVEGAGTVYGDEGKLPPGQWSVRRSNSDIDEIVDEKDMPGHWQEQIKQWNAWADKTLPIGKG